MPPEQGFEPVTTRDAAQRLRRAPGTIASWGTRYQARKVTVHGTTYWDLRDLRVIEREIAHGHVVPATPEERSLIRLRCPLKAARADVGTTPSVA